MSFNPPIRNRARLERHGTSWTEEELWAMIDRHEKLATTYRKELAERENAKHTNKEE